MFFETFSSPSINAVYMTDLENAVFNLLSREIAVAKTIEGEKLQAVKSFLYILKTVRYPFILIF